MSVLTRKHLTKVVIGKKLFNIPKKEADAILALVEVIEAACGVSSEVVYKEVAKNRPRNAVYLRGIRTRENMSQAELSKKTGIAVSNISKLENGARKITEPMAKKLGKALGVDFKKFLS